MGIDFACSRNNFIRANCCKIKVNKHFSGIFTPLKKIVAIFLLITYGFTSVGATVHLHYCMDKFIGADLWHSEDNKCGKCGMTEKSKKGCCKDEHKQIKVDKAQQKSTSDYNFSSVLSPVILTNVSYNYFEETILAASLPKLYAPPPQQGSHIYILHCSYLI